MTTSTRFLAAALAAAAIPCAAQDAPVLLPVHDAQSIARTCDEALARGRALVAALEGKPGGEGFLAEWNALQIAMEDAIYPISLMSSVHPDRAVRSAAEPCLQKYTAFNTELLQNEKVYRRIVALEPADRREQKLKRDLTEGFEDSGVALPPEKRARAKAISARLEEIRQAFERNVREDPARVTFTPEELRGAPEAFLKSSQRDEKGNYVLKADDSTSFVVLDNVIDPAVRKRFYVASMNRGGAENLKLLEEAYGLRREVAALHGLPSFAHLVIKRRMAGNPEAVQKFLGDVRRAVEPVEKRELAELAKLKAADLGQPAEGVRLDRWDASYYIERMKRERFAVDQEKLRRYFPADASVAYALLVAETIYGVRFKEARAPAWHPDVRFFEMRDAQSGKYLASIYVDLFARDGKRGGAFAANVRRASTLAGRTPQSVLVTNFRKEGLNHRELETLMHEFGHVLHGVLSTAGYVSQAGTSTKRDFVEAPSQMFEEWVRREETLALFRKVCADCPVLSRAEIERLEGARKFGRAIGFARQWQYATLDMTLSLEPQPVGPLWTKIEAESPLGHLEGTYKPASFGHLVGGYAAGYYGYMWSQVRALDMLSGFGGALLDPKAGARYRDTILSQGGQDEEMAMVRRFLGREPSSDAFFKELTGSR
ncbi:MAG TPA: M3 family metallopeptidase [Usitatibacter sp.]|nr:M3 family metallopeptidase [Usitatibacter sp.]